MIVSHLTSVRGNGNSRTLLLACFANRTPLKLFDVNGVYARGVISAIEHEDGSGFSFNVRLESDSERYYFRTVSINESERNTSHREPLHDGPDGPRVSNGPVSYRHNDLDRLR